MKSNKNTRRGFIKKAVLGAIGMAGATSVYPYSVVKSSKTKGKGKVILFQGDSITDAGRNRGNYYANYSWGMGNGYVNLIVSELLGKYPDTDLKCYNRGISGNKVYQLANRWEEDCLQLKPGILSILIGVNDFWHTLTNGYRGTAVIFRNDLIQLIDRTSADLPDIKLLLGKPFAVKVGSAMTYSEWFPAFIEYQKAVKEIALKYNAAFVPYQQVFDEALKKADVEYWCPDGVHPSSAGSYLMKQAWMEVFEEMR